ncbi:MAG TPA: hypothetical protein VMW35_14215 [Myxococcota bacterium]|nr:hypothetical protein [Myxococcota bacterium]
MPLYGTLDVKARAADAPRLAALDAPEWQLPGAEVLHLLFETEDAGNLALLPPALHPTIPPTCHLVVIRAPESPAGAFVLAQLRVGCRAGAFQRGFVTRAFCDSARAAAALCSAFGFDARAADVRLVRRHDEVSARVTEGGRAILACSLGDPVAIGPDDVRYVDALNLAWVPRGGESVLRLVQVDARQRIHTADRGRPRIASFDAPAWAASGLVPDYGVSASFCSADLVLPRIRFLVDPEKPAFRGTEKLGA